MKVRGIALWRVILLVVLVAIIAAGSWLWFDWARFARSPLAVPAAGQSIDVARGASFKDIVRDLRNRKASQGVAVVLAPARDADACVRSPACRRICLAPRHDTARPHR